MDPLSQAVVGANLSQCFAKKENFKVASIAGILGGVLPDIDVLISSSVDPMLALQFHRHFTHSLLMVPVLALPVTFVVWFFNKKRVPLKEVYFYALLGVLTHGLLDACTSYGTQLLWPFTNLRVAWNNIAIIDPLFTIPALFGIIFADQKRMRKIAHITFFYMIAYLLFGVYQREAATVTAQTLASQRGHNYIRIEAKPAIGSLALWRTLYETPEQVFYVDAVNTLPFLGAKIYEGSSAEKWTIEKATPAIPKDSVLAYDIERFHWFSDDYLYKYGDYPAVIGDLRYATIPNSLEPLWGIVFDAKSPDKHVDLEYFRTLDDPTRDTFADMLLRR